MVAGEDREIGVVRAHACAFPLRLCPLRFCGLEQKFEIAAQMVDALRVPALRPGGFKAGSARRTQVSRFGYTGADCMGWMREAGFQKTRVEPLVAGQSLVVGFK